MSDSTAAGITGLAEMASDFTAARSLYFERYLSYSPGYAAWTGALADCFTRNIEFGREENKAGKAWEKTKVFTGDQRPI